MRCFSIFVFAVMAAAQKQSGLPPLIDRELFFGNPEIAGAQISPDGKYIAFLKPWSDTRNVWVKKTEEPFSAARRLTAEAKRPISGYLWSRDSKYILYVKDNDGDENFNVYAVDPSAPLAESRDLTGLKGVRVELFSTPKSDPDALYIGLNDRDKAWHDLYKLKISTGERTLIRKNTERISGWDFDLAGQLRLAERVADNGDQEILRVDANGFTLIYSCSVFETCLVERFHKDGKRAYIQTNKGMNLTALALLDPATATAEVVESDPVKHVDFDAARFSEATDELVATTYTEDRQRHYFKDKSFETDYRFLQTKLSGRELSIPSTTSDDRLWLVVAYGDTEPGETYLFDRKKRTLVLQYMVREKLPRAALGEMKSLHYMSSDGLDIPAYLTLPKGVTAKNLPALVIPHGGPWARDYWGYNSLAQFFANRGYAVLMLNFRGSTGYGKRFLNAGNGEWGRKMQDDVTWGVKYLIAEGIADPKRIGILGGSYGGYATLAGVAFTPDVYRAGVDIVGPSNLITLLEAIPPYWETARKSMYARMADPGTPQGKAWMEERSPLNSANKIKTPLMVVQGANDPRVNRREAEQIVVALRDRGFPVEYILAPDEGHGFQRPVNNMAMFMAAEKFLATYLDGRYQDRGTPEVEARLKEITVDPKTVKISKPVDAAAVGAPKPIADLAASVDRYEVKLSVGGQEMALKLSTAVTEENGRWVATETLDTPMGQMTDVSTIEKGSLLLRKRSVKQGPTSVNVEISGNQVTGTMSMNGQDRPISADTGGPLFADAGGTAYSIACLPLADGYTISFRNFDLQKQKVKLMQLSVAGSETVTVPAGTFTAFRVEVVSDDGSDKSTFWIAKDSRKAVKISSIIASMGGATLVAELAH
jgi:dipeptidyl aminopeptidase/acylaminoacyl peptidase